MGWEPDSGKGSAAGGTDVEEGVVVTPDSDFEALVAQCTTEEELTELVARFDAKDAEELRELGRELNSGVREHVSGLHESVLSVRGKAPLLRGASGTLAIDEPSASGSEGAAVSARGPAASAPAVRQGPGSRASANDRLPLSSSTSSSSSPWPPPSSPSLLPPLTADEFGRLSMAEQEAYLLDSIQSLGSRRDRRQRERQVRLRHELTRTYTSGHMGVSAVAAEAAAEAEAGALADEVKDEYEEDTIVDFSAQGLAERMERHRVAHANQRAVRAAFGAARAAEAAADAACAAANAHLHDWEVEAAAEERRVRALRGDDPERIEQLRVQLLGQLAASSTLTTEIAESKRAGFRRKEGGRGIRVADLYRAQSRERSWEEAREQLTQHMERLQAPPPPPAVAAAQHLHGHPDRDQQAIFWADEIAEQPWGATRGDGAAAGGAVAAAAGAALPSSHGGSQWGASRPGTVARSSTHGTDSGGALGAQCPPMRSALLHAILAGSRGAGGVGSDGASVGGGAADGGGGAMARERRAGGAQQEDRRALADERQRELMTPAAFHEVSQWRWRESQRMRERGEQEEQRFQQLSAKLRELEAVGDSSSHGAGGGDRGRQRAPGARRRQDWLKRRGGGGGGDGGEFASASMAVAPPTASAGGRACGWDGVSLSASAPLRRGAAARRTGKRLVSGDVAMRLLCPAAAYVGNGHTGIVNWHDH